MRRGLLIHLGRTQERFPFMDKRKAIAHVRDGGAIQLDTSAVFSALFTVDERAARAFGYRADPENRRRFLLDADDTLTEIDPKELS